MKKLRYVVLLFVMACVSFAVACSSSGGKTKTTIKGFDVEQSITVDAGTNFNVKATAEALNVVDQNGDRQDVYYDVADADGGYVALTAGRFIVKNTSGYVITYSVYAKDNSLFQKTTNVTVVGTIDLSVEYGNGLVAVGDTVTVNPDCNYSEPVYTYSVTKDGNAVAMQGNTFVPAEKGYYEVTVKADAENAKQATFSYTLYARAAAQKGEVEVFGDDWTIIRELEGYELYNWKLTDTETAGIKRPDGTDGNLITLTTKGSYYMPIYVNARHDVYYYKDLVKQGYNYISLWVYLADTCTDEHSVYRPRGGKVPGTTISGIEPLSPKVTAGEWTELKIRIVDAESNVSQTRDYYGSFTSSYDYYKKAWFPLANFEANNWKHKGNITIYVSDIFAYKGASISANPEKEFDFVQDQEVDFNDYIIKSEPDMQVRFTVSKNGGEPVVVEDGKYIFEDNADYTLKAVSASPMYKASFTQEFRVPNITIKGIRYDATLDLTDYLETTEVSSYTLKQAVVRDSGYVYTDVTTAYPNIITAGVLDTSRLDGIFEIEATGANGKFTRILFEQAQEGVFTWNNLPEVGNTAVIGAGISSSTTAAYTNAGTVTAVDATTDAVLAGKDGTYYRFDSTIAGEASGGWGLKVYPTHSKQYYQNYLDKGDFAIATEFMITKNGSDSTCKWNVSIGQGYGYDGYILYSQKPDVWATEQTTWTKADNRSILLKNVIENWNNVIADGKGGGFVGKFKYGYDEGETEAYTGSFSVYFGNVHLVPMYFVETYVQQNDGTFTLKSRTLQYAGNKSNGYNGHFNMDVTHPRSAITGYKFDENNPENVINGHIGAAGEVPPVVKAYYVKANIEYKNEYYLYNETSGEYELDETLTETLTGWVGQAVEFNNKAIENYVLEVSNQNNVLSGVIALDGSLVLKGYYLPSVKVELGMRTGNFDLSPYVEDVAEITVYQHIITSSETYTFAVNAPACDGKTVDMSSLDGIYTMTVKQTAGTVYTFEFEQYTEGKIVYNNINSVLGANIGTSGVGAQYQNATLSVETVDGKEGNFYVVTIENPHESFDYGMKPYPVHSKAYYEQFLTENYSINYDFYFTKTGENPTAQGYLYKQYSGIIYTGSNNKYINVANNTWSPMVPDTWTTVQDSAYDVIINNWNKITTTGRGGVFWGANGNSNYYQGDTYTGQVKTYLGNITFTLTRAPYSMEYYFFENGEYVKSEQYSTSGVANIGASLTIPELNLDGYSIDFSQDNVRSGNVTENGLTLKLYYAHFEEATLSGLRKDPTLDLAALTGNSEELELLYITQAVVKGTGNVDIDVTEKYASLIDENAVMDTSALDGIFTIAGRGVTTGTTYVVHFEQMVEGQFTWNNLYEGATETAVGAGLSGIWAGDYTGALKVAGVGSDAAAVSGRDGYYYSVEGTVTDLMNTVGYKVYPVHSKEYYQTFYTEDNDVSIIMDYMYAPLDMATTLDWNFMYGYGLEGYSASSLDYNQLSGSWTSTNSFNTWNGRHSISLSKIVNRWNSFLKENSGAYMSAPRTDNNAAYNGRVIIYFGNVHLFTSAFKYTNEYYLYNEVSGEYELDETLTEKASLPLGSFATFNVKNIDGYVFDESNEANVLSGYVYGSGKLTLKGYYVICVENTINGLRNDATLDFGVGAIESYKVTQYVVTTTNGTSGSGASTATVATETKHGIDVTAKHPDLFDANGVADTSKLDGIYRIEAIAADRSVIVYNFEQYVDGQFTWNNIIEGQADYSDYVSGGLMNGYIWQNNGIYQGTATIETVTPTSDANLASYIGGTTRDGNGITDATGIYWKATASKPTSDNDGASLRVYPCHSWEYYDTLWNGATVTYNAFIRDPNNAVTNYSGGQVTVLGYVDSTGANYSSLTINKWITKSFTLNETTFTRLTCTNYSSSTIGGWFVGMRGKSIEIKGDSIELYVGNITAAAAE